MSVVKTWTSQADFEAWTWTNGDTDTVPGSVLIAEGQAMAEGTSPVYEFTTATRHARGVFSGNVPEGANIVCRYRVGATEVACEAASYSDWFNGLYGEGSASVDLVTDMLNRSLDPAAAFFVQWQVRLYAG